MVCAVMSNMLSPYSKPSSWASGTVFATSSCWVKIFTLKLLSSGLLHAAASLVPHGAKLTASTWPLCRRPSLPVATSHMRTVLSSLPLASFVPSGDQKTERTDFEWPLNCHNCLPVFTSHTRTLLSFSKREPLPEAIVRPSGEKSTQLTLAECPLNCHNCLPVFTSHTRTLLSF